MIRGDEIDVARGERVPERFAVRTVADRRRAFEARGASRHVLGGERQIVRACFDGDRQPVAARGAQHRQRRRRRQMHDVDPRAELARETQQHRDRLQLRLRRTRREPGGVAIGRSVRVHAGEDVRRFRVRKERHAAPRKDRQGHAQIRLGDGGELVNARRREKALEAEHAGVAQRIQLAGVAGHDAAPEPDVDRDAAARGFTLGVERRGRRRRRNRIERHVDDCRDAAHRRGRRRRLESFPFRPPRFVDVDVRVDHPWHEDEVAGVADVRAARRVVIAPDRRDRLANHAHARGTRPLGRDHACRAKNHLGRHRSGATVSHPRANTRHARVASSALVCRLLDKVAERAGPWRRWS